MSAATAGERGVTFGEEPRALRALRGGEVRGDSRGVVKERGGAGEGEGGRGGTDRVMRDSRGNGFEL